MPANISTDAPSSRKNCPSKLRSGIHTQLENHAPGAKKLQVLGLMLSEFEAAADTVGAIKVEACVITGMVRKNKEHIAKVDIIINLRIDFISAILFPTSESWSDWQRCTNRSWGRKDWMG